MKSASQMSSGIRDIYLFPEIVPKTLSCFWNLLIENVTFLLSLKDGKSGYNLIHNRAMKGNRFDTGLT